MLRVDLDKGKERATIESSTLAAFCSAVCNPFCLFTFFLALYTFWGMAFSYPDPYPYDDVFFGGDTARAAGDISRVGSDHYRISVHPLFLILVQPLFSLFGGIISCSPVALIIFQAVMGATLVALLSMLLAELNINIVMRALLAMIFGFSASQMIWSSVSETFLLGGTVLCAYWWYLLRHAKVEGKLQLSELGVLVLFFAMLGGLTITNVLAYAIGIVFLLLARQPKQWIRSILILGVGAVLVFIAASLLQSVAWSNTPPFWSSMRSQTDLSNGPDLIFGFASMSLEPSKLSTWFSQTALFPLSAPQVCLNEAHIQLVNHVAVKFDDYVSPMRCAIGTFMAISLLVVCMRLIFAIKDLFSGSRNANSLIFLFFLIAWLAGVGLHYFYDYREAFLFSPHYLFLFVMVLGMAVDGVAKRASRTVFILITGILLIYLLCELVGNSVVMYDIATVVREYINVIVRWSRSLLMALFVGALASAGGYACNRCSARIQGILTAERLAVGYVALIIIVTGFTALSY